MRSNDLWSHDVVLKAMCKQVKQQHADGMVADFILVTGDIAFSGQADEYSLASEFLDTISTASGVPRNYIFCVAGNHDIDRSRQELCFLGARESLQNQNKVDVLLAGGEDLDTLLKRQENYQHFQASYFSGQERISTDDGLAYISWIRIDDIRLAIIGLNSAWLAEGGMSDHGKLLIGERQIINAINAVKEHDDAPHIIVSMAHHPFHSLAEFDRLTAQNHIERICHFFQCGHIHEPEARSTGYNGSGCLILSAGASFRSRQSRNTYSFVTLDLLQASRIVKTIQYNPSNGTFSLESTDEYPIEVTPCTCSVSELAEALRTHNPTLKPLVHYLSALLLNKKAELPIPTPDGYTFGSFEALMSQDVSEMQLKTKRFMSFRNILHVLYKRIPLSDIFIQHGTAVSEYGNVLLTQHDRGQDFMARLTRHEKEAQMLANTEPRRSFSHTITLLNELSEAQEWDVLREHAQRHLDSPIATLAILAKRMMALSLAHSNKHDDIDTAIELYRSLYSVDTPEQSDIGNLVTLLMRVGNSEDAKTMVLQGIKRFPVQRVKYFSDIGQRIVKETGDRNFRKCIEDAIAEKGKYG